MSRSVVPWIWFITAAGLFSTALSQATHRVIMGVAGSFYDPPTIAAQQDDIVTFVFGNGIHGVTQSSFETPCVPLAGGFNSGLVSGLNTSEPVKIWELIITNASQPIWFFCQATRPQSHCAAGMVGAINAPAGMFPVYEAAAKTFTGTQEPTPLLALSGIGAVATNSPSAPPGSVAPSSSMSSTSSVAVTTVSITPTPVAIATSTVNVGAVAGGVVGGVVVLAVIIILVVLLYRSNHRQQARRQQQSREGFLGSQNQPRHLGPPRSPPSMHQYPGSEQTFVGVHRKPTANVRSPSIISGGSGSVADQYQNLPPLPPGAAPASPQHLHVDVRELAREVAALMNMPSGSDSLRSPSDVASNSVLDPRDPRNRSDSNISSTGPERSRTQFSRY